MTAEAVKIMFTDKELTYKVLAKQLRISDRKLLDAAYDEEIKVMEPRLEFKMDSFQAIIDETAKVDPRGKKDQAAGRCRPDLSGPDGKERFFR